MEEGGCQFAHCIPANMVVLDPALPKEISADRLGILYPAFKAATSLYQQSNPLSEKNNVTLAVFNNNLEGTSFVVMCNYITSNYLYVSSALKDSTIPGSLFLLI